jgi:hypothetical protein
MDRWRKGSGESVLRDLNAGCIGDKGPSGTKGRFNVEIEAPDREKPNPNNAKHRSFV